MRLTHLQLGLGRFLDVFPKNLPRLPLEKRVGVLHRLNVGDYSYIEGTLQNGHVQNFKISKYTWKSYYIRVSYDQVIVKNKYPLPRIDLFIQLKSTGVFSKID